MSTHSITLRSEDPPLVVEFDLPPGTHARIGSAADAEISLPLAGLADYSLIVGRAADGRIYSADAAGGHQHFIRLPAALGLPPYQFVVLAPEPARAAVAMAAAPPPPPQPRTERRRRKSGLSAAAIAGVAGVSVIGAMFLVLIYQNGRRPAAAPARPAVTADATAPQPAVAGTTPAPALAPALGEAPAPQPPAVAAVPVPPVIAAPAVVETPQPAKPEKIDLETLVQRVSPAVFRLEAMDGSGGSVGTGTAFAISSEGLAVTNYHVVAAGETFLARTAEGEVHEVLYVSAVDPEADLALIMLKGSDHVYLDLGESESLKIGAPLSVYGAPRGLSGTLSEGILSARRNEKVIAGSEMPNHGKLLQMTAPISPGSSGSPVFDKTGKVVAVAAAIFRGESVQNLNIGIPVEAVAKLRQDSRLGLAQKFVPKPRAAPKPAAPTDPNDIYRADPDAQTMADLVSKERFSRAVDLGRILVVRHPRSVTAYYMLGNSLYYSNQYFESERVFRNGLAVAPSSDQLWFGLGMALKKLDRKSDARIALNRCCHINPENELAWKMLFQTYLEEDDLVGSIPALEQIRKFDRPFFDKTIRYFRPSRDLHPDFRKLIDYFDNLR